MEIKEYLKKVEDEKVIVYPPHYLEKFDITRTGKECRERQLQFTLGYIAGLRKAIKLQKSLSTQSLKKSQQKNTTSYNPHIIVR